MRLYFNDLSCGDSSVCLTENFDKVIRFFDLLKHLKSNYGPVNIVLDRKFGGLRICDTVIAHCEYKPGFNFDQRNLIRQLANYIKSEVEIEKQHVFQHKRTKQNSVLLGNAYEHSVPVVSFTFDLQFEAPEIEGEKDNQEISIPNIYDGKLINENSGSLYPLSLISGRECRKQDPAKSPLWNVGPTKAYHQANKDKLDLIKDHPEQKITILSDCADIIAQLNGWELDEGLSKANKSNNKYRRIYRPAKFSKRNAYLSIDFEKPEVYFELHDKKGRHLGEYKWSGVQSGLADYTGHHDIIVR